MTMIRVRLAFALLLISALTLLLSPIAFAQVGTPSRRVLAGGSLPARCTSSTTAKDWFFKSGSSTGLYICTATNSWAGPIAVSGVGDVVGPASATDDAVVRFNGTTGKLLQNSTVTISDAGNLGLAGTAASSTSGAIITATSTADEETVISITNSNAAGTAARSALRINGSTAVVQIISHGSGRVTNRYGVAVGGFSEILNSTGVGLLIGSSSGPLIMGTNASKGFEMSVSVTPTSAFGGNAPDGLGRLQVQMGTSTGNAKVGGTEWYSVTEVGNVGTGEDALIPAADIIANALSVDGSSIGFRAVGSTANNANVKRLRVRLIEGANNNVIYDAGASAIITNSDWVLICEVTRESATLFKSGCSISTTSVSGLVYADYQTGTYTFANAGTIAVTGEATSNNDIVMEWWKGWWSAAP